MNLRELVVEGFRKLETCRWRFTPGLNVVRGPNEAGKSTLQDALVVAMFGDVGSAARDARNRRTWGRDEMYSLGLKVETKAGAQFDLTKDFRSKDGARITYADSTVIEGRKKVAEHLEQLLGLSSEDAYISTACLSQGQFADIRKGQRDLSPLLQEAVTGGAEGVNPEDILKKLKDRISKLETGLNGTAKTPGPLRARQDEIADLKSRIEDAQRQLTERESAQETIDRCNRDMQSAIDELASREATRERVEKRGAIETKLAEARKEAQRLQSAFEGATRLNNEIGGASGELAQSPSIDPTVVDAIRQDIHDAQIHEQQANQATLEAENAAACALQPGTTGCETRAASLGESLSQVTELQAQCSETQAATAALRTAADQAQIALGALMARRRTGTTAAFLGIALIMAGVVAGVMWKQSGLYILAAVGLAVAIWGLARLGQGRIAFAQSQVDDASAKHAASETEARKLDLRLRNLLQSAGVQTVAELNTAWQAARIEDTEAERKAGELAGKADRARAQAQAEAQQAAQLREKAQNALAATGFASIEAMQEALDAKRAAQAKLGEQQAALEATLQGRTIASIEADYRAAATTVVGLEETLNTPDMLAAQMTPEQYQDFIDRIARLKQHIETLKAEKGEASVKLGIAKADAEEVGVLEGALADAQLDLERLTERREVYALVHDVLSAARDETMARASDLVAPRASEHIMAMTGGRYRKIWLEETTFAPHVAIPEQGEDSRCEIGELSCATIEQIYLAIRLALTELLFSKEPLPILLDDPFVNFDDVRREAALKLVREISRQHQVIVFTCTDAYDTYADNVVPLEGTCTLT